VEEVGLEGQDINPEWDLDRMMDLDLDLDLDLEVTEQPVRQVICLPRRVVQKQVEVGRTYLMFYQKPRVS
jgi:hypothetical protein